MLTNAKSFLFQNKGAGQTMIKNTFWLTSGHTISRLIKAVLMIYAARILGTAGYGVFAYALSLVALLSVITDLGIGAYVTRALSQNSQNSKPLLATTLFLKLFLIVLGGLGLVLTAPLFTKFPEALPLIPLVALVVFFDELKDFIMAINRAEQKMEIEAGIHVFTNFFIVALGLTALFLYGSVKSLIAAYAIGSVAGFLLALFLFKTYFKSLWPHFDKSLVSKILHEAWPYALLGLLGIVMINTDVLMLSFLKNESEVGLYAAANRPIQILYVIPAILAASLFPITSRLAGNNNARLRTILEQTLTTSFLIGFPLMVGGIITGPTLIPLVFGTSYASASLAFQILLVTIPIMFPSMILADTVFAYNKQKSFIGLLIIGVVSNIILNLLLIPSYGIVGSAFATIGANLLANTLIWFKMKRINYFSVLPHLKYISLATVLMGIITYSLQALHTPVLINILLSAILYLGILRLVKEPVLKDFRNVLRGSY